MKIRPLVLGLTLGILYALCLVFTTYYPVLSELVFGAKKGLGLIKFFEDVYPYYEYGKWYAPLAGAVCGLIDGFFSGVFVGLLYNGLSSSCKNCECCCEKPGAKVTKKAVVKAVTKAPAKKVAKRK